MAGAEDAGGGAAPRQLQQHSRQVAAGAVRLAHPHELLQEAQVGARLRVQLPQVGHIQAHDLDVRHPCSAPARRTRACVQAPAHTFAGRLGELPPCCEQPGKHHRYLT